MIIRLPVIAATLMAASLSVGTIISFAAPASARQIITCESENNRRNSCSIPRGSTVRLVRRLSSSSCRGNWGYNRNRIWVRNGCRAEFLVSDGPYYRHRRYGR